MLLVACAVLLPLIAACTARGFQPRRFRSAPELYQASVREFQRKKYDNALAGFDLLSSQLPARDTLLAQVYYFQAQAHARKGEHLLAAQAYQRIQDAFPDDSIADEALYQQAREYHKLWRKPTLDQQYGQTALATYRQLLSVYPDSPLVPETGKQIATLNEWFATKDYDTGMHYFRRKAYDSAIIYFRDVTRLFPGTPAAKRAYLRIVEAYQAINYREDVAETCTEARKFYPEDTDVRRACGGAPVAGTDSAAARAAGAPAESAASRRVPPR
jgi:outer membrane protein assembly factor BamD